MDSGTWQATAHGVAESDLTERLSTHMHTHNGKKSENYIHYLLYIYN